MSSREELLNEAIAKAKEAEDWQLADWLRMARGAESAARWYAEKLRKLEDENAKLLALVRDMYVHVDRDSECPMCGYEPDGNMYTERVRELGIKVD